MLETDLKRRGAALSFLYKSYLQLGVQEKAIIWAIKAMVTFQAYESVY